MVWQDTLIAVTNLAFGYGLLKQVIYGFKGKKGHITLQTGAITSLGLYLMAFSFFSLNLYFSAIIAGVNATLWYLLLIQRIIYGKA